jgi:glycosyltransferase involved in cell wall biosynthesis
MHYLIDDKSDDLSYAIARKTIKELPESIKGKFEVIHNDENKGAVYNQIKNINAYCEDSDIVILLDGDDWLAPKNDIFDLYNNIFLEGYDFSYGSCWSLVDNIPLIAQPYPQNIIENRSFRDYKFNWNLPYTHLRCFRKYLINDIPLSAFKDEDGNYFRAGGDVATFYSIIEKSQKIKVVQDIVCMYNDKNDLNDYKVNSEEQTKNAEIIMERKNEPANEPAIPITNSTTISKKFKKILIAVPSAKYVETQTMKSIYDLDIPEGYETELQFFYGYQTDQIRNLIAEWGKRYDYLFSVDSDIVLPKDCLTKMINVEKDIITGMYIQRIPNTHNLELYKKTVHGELDRITCIEKNRLIEIDGCGFGCILINSDVLRKMEYPHFVYKSAIDHKDTISEDVYFCGKAKSLNFKIWVDTSIICSHIGTITFEV